MSYAADTQIFTIDPDAPDMDAIRIAAQTLNNGRLVAFPTETVYGLGANALDADALKRIYLAKKRPATDPIIAHIAHNEQLNTLAVNIPPIAHELAQAFWPGALTLVLERAPDVPETIAAGLSTVAVRMPAHPIARILLETAGVPVAAPSANTFTRPSATTAAHVLQDLNGRVDVILDGGATTIGVESTVLDLTGESPIILRPGGVVIEDLRPIIPRVELAPKYLGRATHASSPGQMLKHYSPDARVMLFNGDDDARIIAHMQDNANRLTSVHKRVGILVTDEDAPHFEGLGVVKTVGNRTNLNAISHSLFAMIRILDGLQVDVILVRDFGRNGLGAALWDRLLRAAEGQVIRVE